MRIASLKVGKTCQVHEFLGSFAVLGDSLAAHFGDKKDISECRSPGKQNWRLKHHTDIVDWAIGWFSAHEDFAAARLNKSGRHA